MGDEFNILSMYKSLQQSNHFKEQWLTKLDTSGHTTIVGTSRTSGKLFAVQRTLDSLLIVPRARFS